MPVETQIAPLESAASALPADIRSRHEADRSDRPDIVRLIALTIMHLGCLAVFRVGWSWTAVGLAFLFYVARAFGLTAFYHRYFSHRAFKTSRWFQFFGGLLGCLAMQKGPLWWAAHHREHHRSSDHDGDVHSPHVHGVIWAHMGWFLTPKNNRLRTELVRDWLRYPELKWLDRLSPLVAVVFGFSLYAMGEGLRASAPGLGVDGPQLFVWVFFVSTVALYHATYCVNSLAHLRGSRRYETSDSSRNNLFVAILTLGEGWHNNHHYYPAAARQGFFWWEIDPTYYGLCLLSKCGIVWNLRPVPKHVLES
jgi:stearoyl-CoA desaturase (delta-9 desaturase)